MEELRGGPVTLDEIVKQCEYRRYGALFKTETSVQTSVIYHLKRWIKLGVVEQSSIGIDRREGN